jgi:hypothetical protein
MWMNNNKTRYLVLVMVPAGALSPALPPVFSAGPAPESREAMIFRELLEMKGSGSGNVGDSWVYSIAILGGTFRLSVDGYGAGLGAGYGWMGRSSVQILTVRNASVQELGGDSSAGIGASFGDYGSSSVGVLTLINGNFTAIGSDGAGIGAGEGQSGISFLRQITIINSSVTAVGNSGAGIGAGYPRFGNSTVYSLFIIGCECTARASFHGAGIGGGPALYGKGHQEFDAQQLFNQSERPLRCCNRIGAGGLRKRDR